MNKLSFFGRSQTTVMRKNKLQSDDRDCACLHHHRCVGVLLCGFVCLFAFLCVSVGVGVGVRVNVCLCVFERDRESVAEVKT